MVDVILRVHFFQKGDVYGSQPLPGNDRAMNVVSIVVTSYSQWLYSD